MKKVIALTICALTVAVASAQSKPKTIACAVMASNKVDIAKATAKKMFADYKGRRYFFCCGGCPEEFAKAPAKFAKSASIKTPKPSKAKA
jgi:YHS domain-containing protein